MNENPVPRGRICTSRDLVPSQRGSFPGQVPRHAWTWGWRRVFNLLMDDPAQDHEAIRKRTSWQTRSGYRVEYAERHRRRFTRSGIHHFALHTRRSARTDHAGILRPRRIQLVREPERMYDHLRHSRFHRFFRLDKSGYLFPTNRRNNPGGKPLLDIAKAFSWVINT